MLAWRSRSSLTTAGLVILGFACARPALCQTGRQPRGSGQPAAAGALALYLVGSAFDAAAFRPSSAWQSTNTAGSFTAVDARWQRPTGLSFEQALGLGRSRVFDGADERSGWTKATAHGSLLPFLRPKAEQHPAMVSLWETFLPPIQAVNRFPVHLSFHNVLNIIPERRALEHVWPGIRSAGRVVRVSYDVKF